MPATENDASLTLYVAYHRWRESLAAMADDTSQLLARQGMSALADQFESIVERLRADSLRIAVIGNFKAGKVRSSMQCSGLTFFPPPHTLPQR